MRQSIGPALRSYWQRLSTLPAGKQLFSRLLGRFVPYSGTIGAVILQLEPGHSVIKLGDRRRVRNHLRSVHAMALANLGEMATGLALLNSLPDKTRAILKRFEISYEKKARGVLIAECHCEIPSSSDACEMEVGCDIRDVQGDVVSRIMAIWLVGPEPSR